MPFGIRAFFVGVLPQDRQSFWGEIWSGIASYLPIAAVDGVFPWGNNRLGNKKKLIAEQ